MKLYVKQPIEAASFDQTDGTKWYRITKEQLLKYNLWRSNVWIKERISQYPLDEVLNLDSLEGSIVEEDQLYLMVSDFDDIEVNGEMINPLDAIEEFGLKGLENYIVQEAPVDVVHSIIDSDISWRGIDINQFAKDLLDDYDLKLVAQDAEEIGLISL